MSQFSPHSEGRLDQRRSQGRLGHLYRLWERLAQQPAMPQLDRWLASELASQRGYGQRDRRWYTAMVFGAVRFAPLAQLYAHLSEAGGAGAAPEQIRQAADRLARACPDAASLRAAVFSLAPAQVIAIGDLRTQWGMSPAVAARPATDPSIDIQKWQTLAAALAQAEDLDLRLLWNGMPLWLAPFVRSRAQGSEWTPALLRAFVDMQATRPPLWLRLNHAQSRGAVLRECAERGWPVSEIAEAMEVGHDAGVRSCVAYRSGALEIQDFASQMIGRSVAAGPGQCVWDCCCGGGGKTVQIAAAVRGHGRVYASDIREHALRELRDRLTRARLTNVSSFVWDVLRDSAPPALPRDGCDWVLVDAPCTGSGTWRRNPDGRLRWAPSELRDMVERQVRLLAAAASHVKHGGHVVYATCSWLCEENEQVVRAFLGAHPAMRLVREELFGCPHANCDTTYAAVLKNGAMG